MVKSVPECAGEARLMRRLFPSLLVMVVGCVLLVSGCGNPSSASVSGGQIGGTSGGPAAITAVTIPEGWVVFESDRISLALPETFEGGVPTDEDVAALLDSMAAIDPSLADWEEAMAGVDVELLMFGEPDANGWTPIVAAQREVMPSGMSMQRYADSYQQAYPESDFEIMSITNDQARYVETYPDWEGFTTIYWVDIRAGSYVYSVMYQADSESYSVLEPVFMTSGDTVVVKE
jgi:hypothetical protein